MPSDGRGRRHLGRRSGDLWHPVWPQLPCSADDGDDDTDEERDHEDRDDDQDYAAQAPSEGRRVLALRGRPVRLALRGLALRLPLSLAPPIDALGAADACAGPIGACALLSPLTAHQILLSVDPPDQRIGWLSPLPCPGVDAISGRTRGGGRGGAVFLRGREKHAARAEPRHVQRGRRKLRRERSLGDRGSQEGDKPRGSSWYSERVAVVVVDVLDRGRTFG